MKIAALKIKIHTLLLSLFLLTLLASFALLTVVIHVEHSTHLIILWSLAIIILLLLLAIVFVIHRISRSILHLSHEIDEIAQLNLENNKRKSFHITEMDLINHSVDSLKKSLRSFSRYVPQEIAKELMRKDHDISLAREKKTISILFTDITNFTTLVESLPLEIINELLTTYFEMLSPLILQQGGTIDKFMGDSIMAIWGAPKESPDMALKACTAALFCQKQLKILNEMQKRKGMAELETRIGIKTGAAIVGNFGTHERMNYSAVGDAVNMAARLQALNKVYQTRILIGEETMIMAGKKFLVRPIETVELKGRKQKIKVYELMAKKEGEEELLAEKWQLELSSLFTKAFNAFEKKDENTAKELFYLLAKQFPNDYPTTLYLQKLEGPSSSS